VQRFLGIDLGGTKIEAAVVRFDGDSAHATVRQRTATERDRGYAHILHQVERLVKTVTTDACLQPEAIGFSIPGNVDPATGLVRNSNTTCLNGEPFAEDLERILGVPVVLENDANCFVLAESTFGVGRDARTVFGVILGTGVGGGLVVNGQLWPGAQAIAGEWGHSCLVPDGLPCWCGLQGCVEQYLSGPSTEECYHALSGESLSLPQIVTKAACPGPAQQTMAPFVRHFGQAMANVVNLLDPDLIVIGGGVGQMDSIYTEGKEAVLERVFHPRPRLMMRKPMLGDSAGVFGAAHLVRQTLERLNEPMLMAK
jgi:fructokinase